MDSLKHKTWNTKSIRDVYLKLLALRDRRNVVLRHRISEILHNNYKIQSKQIDNNI